MRKTIGTLVLAVLVAFGVYMAVFGRGGGSAPQSTPTPVAASPSAAELVAAPLPGVTASAIRQGWASRWAAPMRDTSRQTVLEVEYPNGKGDLVLTMTRVPDDPEAVWGVSCARHGKSAPYRKADLTELLDFCLPPEVAGELRAEIVGWLTPLNDRTWRVHRQFTGYTAVVKHVQPKRAAKDGGRRPLVQLSLTGGTYFPA